MPEIVRKRRKKKKHSPVVDWLAYAAMRAGLFVMYLFSVEANLRFGRFLGRCMWKHYHRGRQRAIDNLRASFPEKDEEWLIKTGRRSFEHIVMLVIDTLFTPRIVKRDNWDRYSTYKNVEQPKWLMQGGRGVIFAASHYGNFEITGYLLGLFMQNVYSIARPLDNKYINNYLLSVRERAGQKIIDKKGATEQMENLAESHATLCFIADQDAGKKGIFVDFFGRKASAYKSIALVAMKYNMPIAVAYGRRIDDKFFFEIGIERLIMPEEWADKDNPMTWITQAYTKATEDFIRRDPSQYWWLHRRWKTQPKQKRKK